MKATYSSLMQSKYFSPAFNSAIFDGPMRIYFAQFHESMALKIYFLAQQKLVVELAKAKEVSKATHSNILVMIYPTEESFLYTFENLKEKKVVVEPWNNDIVIGMNGPLEDSELENFMETLGGVMRQWHPQPILSSQVEM